MASAIDVDGEPYRSTIVFEAAAELQRAFWPSVFVCLLLDVRMPARSCHVEYGRLLDLAGRNRQ